MSLSNSPLALVNGRVFKATDLSVINKGVTIIKGDRIHDIGTIGEVDIPEDAEIIDLKGRTVLPGLIDAHLHITGFKTADIVKEPLITPLGVFFARAVNDLKSLINAGFTTVCDAGSLIGLHLKYAVNEGTVIGPRIVAAGAVLSQTYGHGDEHYLPIEWVDIRSTKKITPFASLICDGVEECRKAARYALREGADFIKIMATGGVMSEKDRPEYIQFTCDEIRAIVEEAEHAGKFVHAHAQGAEGIKNAIKAGVKVIAHAIFMDQEGFELAKEKNVVVVPTLSISKGLVEKGEEVGVPEWALKKAEEIYSIHVETIKEAYKNNVKLATGTDFFGGVFTHGENALELELFVKLIGMSCKEAIISATKIASEAAGLNNIIGTLEKNKIADIIVVDGDPLSNISTLRDNEKILMVIKSGEILKNKLSQ